MRFFINGEKNIGDGRTVNASIAIAYSGLGYGINDKLRLQLGFMNHRQKWLVKIKFNLACIILLAVKG
jgi:hypothetical protein